MAGLIERVEALTEAQYRALTEFSTEWVAGPTLSEHALEHLSALRDAGLVERKFGDWEPEERSATTSTLTVRISACWWFRLTPKGADLSALRAREATHGSEVAR